MNIEDNIKAKKADRTLIRIIVAFILVAVLNACISVSLALSIQDRYNSERAIQQQQSQVVFSRLCTTLESLHAENPPKDTGQSAAYLQDLHNRLGELAVDLKC